jgi:hypothetical protein
VREGHLLVGEGRAREAEGVAPLARARARAARSAEQAVDDVRPGHAIEHHPVRERAPEARRRRERGVDVDRVVVAGERGGGVVVRLAEGAAHDEPRADLGQRRRVAHSGTSTSSHFMLMTC